MFSWQILKSLTIKVLLLIHLMGIMKGKKMVIKLRFQTKSKNQPHPQLRLVKQRRSLI